MISYADVQADVRQHDGFLPKSCWVAHLKSRLGFKMRRASNRQGRTRVEPCPRTKMPAIIRSFIRLNVFKHWV